MPEIKKGDFPENLDAKIQWVSIFDKAYARISRARDECPGRSCHVLRPISAVNTTVAR
jgi:hypothetical protein